MTSRVAKALSFLLLFAFSDPALALGYDAGLLTEASHDPSFESSVQKWTFTSTGSTYGSTTDPANDGSKTFRSTSSTTGFSGRTLSSDTVSGIIAGNVYKLEVGWYASGTEWADNRLEINIEWYNASSVLISTSTSAELSLSAQNTWELKSLTDTAPANATQAKVLIRWRRTSATTSGRQQSFDRVALLDLTTQPVRPNVPTLISPIDGKETTNVFPVFSWTHNDTTSTPQAMYHLQVSTNSGFSSIIFEDTAVSANTTIQISTALPTPVDSTLYWRVRTSNVGTNFSDFPAAEDFRLNNLVANSGFENWSGPLVGDSALNWIKLNSTGSNHVRQTSDTKLSGAKALKIQNPTTSFARGAEADTVSYFVPVTAGQSYRLGAFARKNNNQLTPDSYSVRLQVDWFNASNTLLTTSSFEDAFTAFDAWKKFESDTVTAPSGATKAQFRVQARRTGGTAQSTDHIYVDDVFVRSVNGSAQPAADTSVVINEIMWDELEYIELANRTASAVNIGGWKVFGGGSEEFTITSGATIPARGFYLIAESGAVTVTPNQVATMSLLQEGELLELKTAASVTVDTANQSGAWFAGQNTATGIAMSREDSALSGSLSTNWLDDLGALGGRNGSPGVANDFDSGANESGTIQPSDTLVRFFDGNGMVIGEISVAENQYSVLSPNGDRVLISDLPRHDGDDRYLDIYDRSATQKLHVTVPGFSEVAVSDNGSFAMFGAANFVSHKVHFYSSQGNEIATIGPYESLHFNGTFLTDTIFVIAYTSMPTSKADISQTSVQWIGKDPITGQSTGGSSIVSNNEALARRGRFLKTDGPNRQVILILQRISDAQEKEYVFDESGNLIEVR